MKTIIQWLSEHRVVNVALLLLYFLLVVLPHVIVGKFIIGQLSHLSRPALNDVVLKFLLPLFLLFVFFVFRKIYLGAQRKEKTIYLFLTLGLIIIIYNSLFVLATEMAHFPQYAMMAILIFPLNKNYLATLFWATVLGTIDEAYQYLYLAPNSTNYFDFNDVITDFLGAVLGLILIWCYEIKNKSFDIPWYKRSHFVFSIVVGIILLVLYFIGILSIYPPNDGMKPLILLVKKIPQSFWSYDRVGDLYFHIITPLEAVLSLIFLFSLYRKIGRQRE